MVTITTDKAGSRNNDNNIRNGNNPRGGNNNNYTNNNKNINNIGASNIHSNNTVRRVQPEADQQPPKRQHQGAGRNEKESNRRRQQHLREGSLDSLTVGYNKSTHTVITPSRSGHQHYRPEAPNANQAGRPLPTSSRLNRVDIWTRVYEFVGIRQKVRPPETQRRIRANNSEFNAQFNYANNYIKTSKYTVLTFVPRNLFEQFQRLANFYFLCLLVLQLIPQISSLTPVTTAVPLIVVLTLTAAKDALDDIQRHRSDNSVNNRLSKVLRGSTVVEERWHKVQVGDLIFMENDQFVAADLLLLSSSEPNGLCYIETAELDGETNLKCRQALPDTAEMANDAQMLAKFNGEIVCELPNNNLNKFEGALHWRNQTYALDNDKILLRGCVLRNTHWCYGMVIFAGRDTKLMQNSGKTIFKRTSLDRLLNVLILGIVFFLFSICSFCSVACSVWETVTGQYFRDYLPWDSIIATDNPVGAAALIALLVFFSYIIVLNTVVPISLYVSVEVIRFWHSLWINWDEKMYYLPKDQAARARTTTLNEELGQIEYIFSDKTGTLTQNIMTFNKASIQGRLYGEIIDPSTGEPMEVTEEMVPVDFSANVDYEAKFKFYDQTLLDDVRKGEPHVQSYFRILALCHTVMSEVKDGVLEYQAQSPDEEALTSAARNFGFVFKNRTPKSITISVWGAEEVYELLAILDFNNVRKRMSVIVRNPDGQLKLYCKGADSVIFERLSETCKDLQDQTMDHLNKFAGEGLRTLCLAYKDIDEDYFEQWTAKHHAASVTLENREEAVDAVYEEIETNLILIGATAIEDKLQDGVPQAIANLAAAGIKLWVLTGDKQETAINIGYSCQLLTDEMVDIFIVDGTEKDEVWKQLQTFRENITSVVSQSAAGGDLSIVRFHDDDGRGAEHRGDWDFSDSFGGFALIVNGYSLVHALGEDLELLFLEVACRCKAVVCCRVTPLQKALVVDLVKRHKNAVTLAIGDGANDVSMIKMAHIGVGISGQEGMQAVLASDFSIAQFRFLERLLLVHGRWSYLRMCRFLRYFFYKNFAFTLCHFWFAFFCGFSAQTLYDPVFISFYNVFYTSLPVLALGVFDQDVNDYHSIRYPKLYTPGHMNLLFNKVEFLKSVAHGVVTSFVLFFIPYGAFNNSVAPSGENLDGHQLFGTVVSTILVLIVNCQIAVDTTYWTLFNHVCIWGSVAFYFAITLLINSDFIGNAYIASLRVTLGTGQFWFVAFLTVTILMLPVVAFRFFYVDVFPTLSDRVRLKQRLQRIKSRPSEPHMITTARSLRRSRRSIRSGYAFAHQEGFGRLIMSGKIMKKSTTSAQMHHHITTHLPNQTAD
ncbi:probable phospholipid-transporting ATPase IM [Varroa jacobsoni]|uniref:Phospholipid-transporting ATPase n=1 Tax=Varroa destructor TaxID=109461 RepID=A0A7M7KQ53_VARDE|nr:probable phospholipid-transporting ATPase IM isoform X2 [Varroa destructor]XP_022687369.1 probable phospholipid-transporting ATPase IM [Varroa jacobsoni]